MHEYSMWLVETGRNPQFPRSQLLAGEHNTGTVAIPNGFLAIKGAGHLAVIDTGSQADEWGVAEAASYGTVDMRDAGELLPAIDLDPADVDAVFITHAHWDHMGNLGAFPNATIYIQARELSEWVRAGGLPTRLAALAYGVSDRDLDELVVRLRRKQVFLVDGSLENVLPGVDLVATHDTHTWGHQIVSVATGLGPRVAVGDLIFNFANFEGLHGSDTYVPTGQAIGGLEKVLQAYDHVASIIEGTSGGIVPCHDMEAYERFPSRETVGGLRVAEVSLAAGESSRVR